MIVGTAIASIGVFLGALWRFEVIRVAALALTTSRGAVAVMRDEGLDDRARETAIQRASLRLFAGCASLAGRLALAAAAAFVPIGLASATGLAAAESVLDFLSRWEAALIATALGAAVYGFRMLPWRTN